jgi:gliding motility-associated-like protein
MKNFKLTILLSVLAIWLCPIAGSGQLIGGSAYMIGDNVEIGINDAGHEGAPRLIGSNNRSNQALGSPVYFGFVANPQLDGWGDYDGDFFTPGTPENGFGLEIDGINYSNNASGTLEQIEGSITDYTHIGNCISVQWDGSIGDVDMQIIYRLVTTELYYTTEVTLTNNGASDLTDVYYYRNVDPDNNITLGAGYSTQNTIVAQPADACETALVTATQAAPWASYIGFGALGPNFRVSYGGFANRDASNIWNGVAGMVGTVGASAFADRAISLAYKAETLAVGTPETFMFTIVLDADQIDAALSSLYYFEYDGIIGEIDECDPVVDTANVCPGGTVELSVDGPDVDGYVWEWGPADGLSTVDGPITEASPAATTTYTVTGTPSALCLSSPIEKTIVVQVNPLPEISVDDYGVVCSKLALADIVITNLEGTPGMEIEFYDVVPDSIDQIVGLWPTDSVGIGDEVYILMYDPETGCYDVEPLLIDFNDGPNAGEDNTLITCNDEGSITDLNSLLSAEALLGGTWTETSVIASGGFTPLTGMFDASGVTPGEYTFEYLLLGEADCIDDTALVTVTVNREALAGLDGTATLCNSTDNTIDLNELLDGNNDIGIWLETTASDQFDPATGVFDAGALPPGDYTFTYTVDAELPCTPDVADFTITVLAAPVAGPDNSIQVCATPGTVIDLNELLVGADFGGTWTNDMGMPGFNAPMGTANISSWDPGTYTFTYAVGSLLGDALCPADEAVMSIIIRDNPAVNAGTDEEVCIGETVVLEASGAGAEGVYTWSDGILDGVPFVVTESATYTVIGTDEYGCENTDEVDVIALELPAVDAGPDLPVCIGSSVTLTGTGAGMGAFYEWDGGAIDGMPVSPVVTTTYAVIGTDANGCVNTDEMTVVVNPLPIIFAGEDEVSCIDDIVVLAGSGAGPGGSYVWDAGVVDGVGFVPAADATYTVTGTDINGCSNTDDVFIAIAELPVITSGDDVAICFGDEAVLVGSGAGVDGEYVWTDGIIDGVPFIPTETGTYMVTGTDENGCKDEDEITVIVNPLPIVDAGPDTVICIGAMVTLSGSGAGIGATYEWDGGGVDGVPFAPVITNDYTMIATDANGCVASDSVNVAVNPLPEISAGTDIALCDGFETVLSGDGAGVDGSYDWGGVIVDGEAFIPEATAVYTVFGTDANGCVNSDEVLVVVFENPAVIAGFGDEICLGDEVTLEGAGAGADGEYVWSGGILDDVAFAPTETMWYSVVGTDSNGCIGEDSVHIIVNPLPIVEASEDTFVCEGESVVLSASGAGPDGTYAWDGDVVDGVPFTPEASASYTVIGTDENGCENFDIVVVEVKSLPAIYAGVDQEICFEESVTLSGSGAGAEGTYEWTGTVENGVPFEPMLTYTYTVTGTDTYGCVNSDEVEVIVNALPVVVAEADKTICLGGLVTLSGSGAGYGGTYAWDYGITDGVSFNPAVTNMYTVTGTNAAGCVNMDSIWVNVLPLPEIDFIADNSKGCAPLVVNFVALSDGATYDWSFGDGWSDDGGATTHIFEYDGSYDVTLTVTSEEGCVNSATFANYVDVDKTPIAGFTYSPDELTIANTFVEFENTSLGGDYFKWNFGDGSAENADINPSHYYPEIGNSTYRVDLIAISTNGCSDTTQQILNFKDQLLYFVPNAFTPDGDTYNEMFKPVFVSGLDVYDFTLMIFNRWGEVVFESHNVDFGWDGTYGNRGMADDGIYIWKLEFGETMSDKKHYDEGHITLLK